MRTKILKISLIVAIVIFAGVGFNYFFGSKKVDTTKSPLSSASATPKSTSTMPSDNATSKTVNKDTQFLSTLLGLSKINIDNTIFANKSFSLLEDNNVEITSDVSVGRDNPFAPIENTSKVTVISVSTLPASQITTTSVILSGVLGSGVNPDSINFQWGLSPDKLTNQLSVGKESLVGTFSKPLVNLKPKTTYYTRAMIRSSGNDFFGEIISFTTQ